MFLSLENSIFSIDHFTIKLVVVVVVVVVVDVVVVVVIVTVSVALLLAVLPAVLVTAQRNVTPSSSRVVVGVVYDALVAPEMSTPFFFH